MTDTETAACSACRRDFDPADPSLSGAARYRDTPWCRRCVDRCHDTEIADHRCPVCATHDEEAPDPQGDPRIALGEAIGEADAQWQEEALADLRHAAYEAPSTGISEGGDPDA